MKAPQRASGSPLSGRGARVTVEVGASDGLRLSLLGTPYATFGIPPDRHFTRMQYTPGPAFGHANRSFGHKSGTTFALMWEAAVPAKGSALHPGNGELLRPDALRLPELLTHRRP